MRVGVQVGVWGKGARGRLACILVPHARDEVEWLRGRNPAVPRPLDGTPAPETPMIPARAITLTILIAAAAQPASSGPVLDAAAPICVAGVKDAYRKGYADGVDAIGSQLAQSTARMQEQVQAQLNEQLRQLQRQSSAELDTRIAAAQEKALEGQGAAVAGGSTIAPDARMPSLSATIQSLDARTARGAGAPAARPAPAPADPAALPPGTTITITDPQALPPELFRALMDFASR